VKRLDELRAGFDLSEPAVQKLRSLVELLGDDPDAPTSVTGPEEAVDAHIADSLSALPLAVRLLAERRLPETIVDIGSGAGFPGLPVAIVLEQAEVDLVEATARKCRFIERAIERVGQGNARVVCARAEEWAGGEGAGRYALALTRAVAPLSTLVEYASPLLREHGFLIAWKGARATGEERRGAVAAGELGMTPLEIAQVHPFPGARSRYLHVFEKTGPTPEGIPRRPGRARKRPFGA
jgi:16S rRNA (guanine527-N7)-methyltransferase